jgi:hypothetical protein
VKRLSLILAALLFATPAFASEIIQCGKVKSVSRKDREHQSGFQVVMISATTSADDGRTWSDLNNFEPEYYAPGQATPSLVSMLLGLNSLAGKGEYVCISKNPNKKGFNYSWKPGRSREEALQSLQSVLRTSQADLPFVVATEVSERAAGVAF